MAEKKAKKLVNTTYPYEKIYVPELKEYRQFQGGLLELAADDPAYDFMIEHGKKDANVSIHEAKAEVGPDGVPGQAQLKAAGGQFVCDVCVPPQAFGSEEALAEHNLALHAVAPQVSEATGEVKEPPKARGPQVRAGTAKTS